MNCWELLQLAPTTDVRAIKKAYAVLLKLNKPDENPAGFQQLHAAYQQALQWADRNAQAAPPASPAPALSPVPETPPMADATPVVTPPISAVENSAPANAVETIAPAQIETPPPQPTPPLIKVEKFESPPSRLHSDVPLIRPEPTHVHGQPFLRQDEPLSAEEEAWENFLDQQWDSLVDQVEGVLEQKELRNDPRAWDFLVHAEALLDIEFKAEFSLRFLQRLVQIFDEQQESTELMLLPDTVRYLNNTFWWDQRRQHLEEHFEEDELDTFMAWWQPPPMPAATTGAVRSGPPIPYANYYRRWLALIIDGALLFAVGWLVNLAGGFLQEQVVFAALFSIAAYAVLNPLFEASPLQGSPGKYWCQMKVCNSEGERLPLWRALLRCALFGVSLYFIYITIIANMLIWDGRLLHDRLSGSCVLRRQA